MNSDEIQRYLQLLGEELQQRGVTGEIVMAGGAVMLLVIRNRETTAAHLHLSHWQEILPIISQYIPSQYIMPRTEYLIQSLFP